MLCTVCICCAQLAQQKCLWIWNSEHYKDKKACFLFSLCIIGVCSLKKITSWIQGTSSRQRMFGKMDFWISHQRIALIFCFVLKVGATESKFVFFSLAFVMVSVCLNSHPVRLSANGKQISLLTKRRDVFLLSRRTMLRKAELLVLFTGERAHLYLIRSSHTNK